MKLSMRYLVGLQVEDGDEGMLGSGGVVGTADGRVVGRGMEDVGILGGLGGDAVHDVDEGVQRLLALRLRRLDHQGLMEEQREVDGGSVETEVEQTLGDVERRGRLDTLAGTVVDEAVEDELVLADGGDGELIGVLELLLDVVGVEGSDGSYLADVLAADGEQPGTGAKDDAEVAHVAADTACRLGIALGDAVRAALVALHGVGVGEALLEEGLHADRTASGAATAVRRGERLVEVEVHDVEAHIAGAYLADEGVHVGSVVVEQTAGLVDEGGNLLDLRLEEAEGVGVGHHDAGEVGTEEGLEVLHVDEAVGVGLDDDDLKAADGCRGGVRAVGTVGDDDLRAGQVAAVAVVGAHDHEACELAVGSSAGVEGEVGHARDGGEHLLHLVVDSLDTLHGADGLQRMDAREGGHGGDGLVDLRVVLHGAAAEGIETGVDAEVHLREIGVVADDIDLADLGEGKGRLTLQRGGDGGTLAGGDGCAGKGEAFATGLGVIEYQMIVVSHRAASFTSLMSESISSRVRFSVTAKAMRWSPRTTPARMPLAARALWRARASPT